MAEECIFCRIAQKKSPASVVYEDKSVIAFMDIRPVNIGHTLVIPKKHYRDIHDMPAGEVGKLFKVVKKVADMVKKRTHADGVSVIESNGKAALQDVMHMHVHVIPRFEKDKVRDAFVALMKPLLMKPTRGELEDVARTIRAG